VRAPYNCARFVQVFGGRTTNPGFHRGFFALRQTIETRFNGHKGDSQRKKPAPNPNVFVLSPRIALRVHQRRFLGRLSRFSDSNRALLQRPLPLFCESKIRQRRKSKFRRSVSIARCAIDRRPARAPFFGKQESA